MSNIVEQKLGNFLIRAISGANDDIENGISVFVVYRGEMVFCDNFGDNLYSAREYIKRNSKGKIKVVNGEFYSK